MVTFLFTDTLNTFNNECIEQSFVPSSFNNYPYHRVVSFETINYKQRHSFSGQNKATTCWATALAVSQSIDLYLCDVYLCGLSMPLGWFKSTHSRVKLGSVCQSVVDDVLLDLVAQRTRRHGAHAFSCVTATMWSLSLTLLSLYPLDSWWGYITMLC